MRDSALHAEALEILRGSGREKSYTARLTIYACGDVGDSLAIVESGVVRISLFGNDGRELALALLGEGEVVGEIAAIDNKQRAADVIAVGRVRVTMIPAAELRKLIHTDKTVTDFFLQMLCQRLRSTNDHAESHALNSLAERLSLYFVNHGFEEDDGSLTLDNLPSQSELARLVGGARVCVNLQFRTWRDSGLLVDARHGFRVPDPVSLQESAMGE